MDTDPEQLTAFDGLEPAFESACRENGFTSWSAVSFAEVLGYANYEAFHKAAINKVTQVFLTLGIDMTGHMKQETFVDESGKSVTDLRLSRFACYLAAMNSDPRKPAVAKAQAYFAALADACAQYMEAESIERVISRDEISSEEKSLSSTVKRAGVQNYAFFQNAGYRGLYTMNLKKIRELKKVPAGRCPLDFMGSEELAANLFRITQTRARITKEGTTGQSNLERVANEVGKTVRNTMVTKPEHLPPSQDIKKVKTGLKLAGKSIQKIDK